MRSRSGFLRWDHTWITLVFVLLAVCTYLPSTAAGPTRYRRQLFTSKELTSDNVQAEETCMLNGKEELRSSVQCSPKPGCRKIEIRDECCPLYKCDCQFNDRTFENNEKISDPSTPCHVCLCRGGEIKCTTVTCYNRNDCASTTFVEGVCCPQYDNCPPLEDNNLGAVKDSSPAADTSNGVSTKEQLLATTTTTENSPSSTTVATTVEPFSNDNPLGIKIKEITKPEEIRITDDKPKHFKPPTRSTTATSNVTPAGQFSTAGPSSLPAMLHDINLPEYESSGSEILPEDDIQPEQPAEMSSSSSESTTSDIVDDLSQFESTDDRFIESSGVKSIRQTEIVENIAELSTISSTTDSGLSDSSQPSSTLSSSTSSTLDSSEVFTSPSSLSIGAEITENSQLIYIKGKPFKIREVDGLTRGNDDEDEIKAGRKPSLNVQNMFTTIASLTDDLGVLTTSTTAASIEGSGNTVVYDTEYHEVVSDDGSASSAVFDTKLASGEEQLNIHSETEAGSHEFIDVLHLGAGTVEFDGSGGADRMVAFTEQPDIEGSSDESATSLAVSIVTPTSEDSSIALAPVSGSADTAASPIPTTSGPMLFQPALNSDNDDKTREFPEQSDDYSVHGRMQNEDLVKASNVASLTGDESDAQFDAEDASDPLRVIPIGRTSAVMELSTVAPTTTSEVAPSSYSDVQERSPGEPFLIPEWERNATTESAVLPPKVNRKDSLILLPVNDVAEYGVHSVAASAEVLTKDALSTSATEMVTRSVSDANSTEDDTGSSTARSAELLNEVAEARSVDDGFADQLFGNSKLKYYFHAPGEFFRYQEKIMNS